MDSYTVGVCLFFVWGFSRINGEVIKTGVGEGVYVCRPPGRERRSTSTPGSTQLLEFGNGHGVEPVPAHTKNDSSFSVRMCVIRSIFIAKNSEDTRGKEIPRWFGISFPVRIVCSCVRVDVHVLCMSSIMVVSRDLVF